MIVRFGGRPQKKLLGRPLVVLGAGTKPIFKEKTNECKCCVICLLLILLYALYFRLISKISICFVVFGYPLATHNKINYYICMQRK